MTKTQWIQIEALGAMRRRTEDQWFDTWDILFPGARQPASPWLTGSGHVEVYRYWYLEGAAELSLTQGQRDALATAHEIMQHHEAHGGVPSAPPTAAAPVSAPSPPVPAAASPLLMPPVLAVPAVPAAASMAPVALVPAPAAVQTTPEFSYLDAPTDGEIPADYSGTFCDQFQNACNPLDLFELGSPVTSYNFHGLGETGRPDWSPGPPPAPAAAGTDDLAENDDATVDSAVDDAFADLIDLDTPPQSGICEGFDQLGG